MRLDRVAVVGGGIAGLAAARRLRAESEVVLFEADPRLGGKFDTEIVRGRPVDLGADSFITRNGAARELCEELGLGAELAAPQGRFAVLDSRDGLIGFPAGLAIGIPTRVSSLRSAKVVSRAASLRAALDYLLPGSALPDDPVATARAGGRDDSVARVVGRRLGRGVLYGLVDPLVGGINASDVDVLSFAAALPELAGREPGAGEY